MKNALFITLITLLISSCNKSESNPVSTGTNLLVDSTTLYKPLNVSIPIEDSTVTKVTLLIYNDSDSVQQEIFIVDDTAQATIDSLLIDSDYTIELTAYRRSIKSHFTDTVITLSEVDMFQTTINCNIQKK